MATALFECPKCHDQIQDEVMPECPQCECGSFMREVPGTMEGELSLGMQRDLREYAMERD